MSNQNFKKVISFAREDDVKHKKKVISFATENTEQNTKKRVISFATEDNIQLNMISNITSNKTCITEPNKEVNNYELKCSINNDNNASKVKLKKAIHIDSIYYTKPRNFYNYIDGTYVELRNPDFSTQFIKLCNFTVDVLCKLIIDDGNKKKLSYKIKCTLNDIRKEKTLEFNMYDLKTKESFLNKIGGEFSFIAEENAYEYFKEHISELIKKAPEETIYTHIGWRKFGDKWVYLVGNESIGDNLKANGAKDKVLKIDKNLNEINAAQLSLKMLNISSNVNKTLPLLLYLYLSLMKSLFTVAKAMPRFILWIYGETGSMKTSVSKCFFSIFNNCDDISATFKYTKAALEIKSSEYADSCLLVDDYHPTMTKPEKADMDSKAGMLLRIYGDEASTGRGSKDMQKTIEVNSKGLCVITGENKFGSKSDLARLVTVEITKDDIIPSVLSFYQNNPKIFPTHIYYFLNWVSINAESIIDLIQKRVNILREQNSGLFSHKRYIDSYILFCITAEILLNYYTSIGLNLDRNAIYCEWTEILKKMIQVQDTNTIQQDPGVMFVIALQNMLIGNMCSLDDVDGERTNKTNIIGYKDNEYIYLSAELAYEKICKFWKGQGIEYPLTKDSALEALERINVLIAKDEGDYHRRTIKCSIKGVPRRRYAKLIISKMDELLNDI